MQRRRKWRQFRSIKFTLTKETILVIRLETRSLLCGLRNELNVQVAHSASRVALLATVLQPNAKQSTTNCKSDNKSCNGLRLSRRKKRSVLSVCCCCELRLAQVELLLQMQTHSQMHQLIEQRLRVLVDEQINERLKDFSTTGKM